MDFTLHNAILDTTLNPVHLGIQDGKIAVISSEPIEPGTQAMDAGGAMVSPPFAEAHFHLENAMLWDTPNRSGTLREAIEIYAEIKKNLGKDNLVDRSTKVLRSALSNGVLWLRNHVDIDQVAQLRLLEGILAAKEKFAGVVDVQIVAFPQLGLARNPEAVDLMHKAMEMGANVVGGMPHGEKDMDDAARHIEIAFEIAKKYNADIDMHTDETDDPYWRSLELLAEKTLEEGYSERVVASHCCAMGSWDDATAERIIAKVAKAGVNVTTNVPVNSLLQGRGDSHPFRRGIPRVKDLLAAGVNVATGQDDLLNMFYPFGRMDPLEVANYAAHLAHLSSLDLIQTAFDMPRYNAAKNIRLADYGLHVGGPANLIVLDATSPVDAIRRQPMRTLVMREGRILVQNEDKTHFTDGVPC